MLLLLDKGARQWGASCRQLLDPGSLDSSDPDTLTQRIKLKRFLAGDEKRCA